MEVENKEQIMEMRKEIEKELLEALKEVGSDFTLEDIKEIIYNEEEQGDYMKVFRIFDQGQGAGEMQSMLDLATEAWNYFPHKILNGLSPAERILEHKEKNKK